MQALTFQNTQFDIIDRNNQSWLQAVQIAKALGYAREDSVSRIYDRNKDEFTSGMSQTVNLTVKGFGSGNSEKEVRIFSLRGAHLIAMFSRTKVAKEFRKWVLDVLDNEVQQPTAEVKALPSPLTSEQQSIIKDLVKSRVETLPPSKQAKAAITCWSALKSKFGCSYKEIESDQFSDAVSLVARITLEGEFLGKEEPKGVMTEDDLYKVYLLSNNMNHLYDIFNKYNMYESLKALGSRAGIEMIDHILDGNRHANQLVKTYAQALDDYQRKLRINHYSCTT